MKSKNIIIKTHEGKDLPLNVKHYCQFAECPHLIKYPPLQLRNWIKLFHSKNFFQPSRSNFLKFRTLTLSTKTISAILKIFKQGLVIPPKPTSRFTVHQLFVNIFTLPCFKYIIHFFRVISYSEDMFIFFAGVHTHLTKCHQFCFHHYPLYLLRVLLYISTVDSFSRNTIRGLKRMRRYRKTDIFK